ncbi:hypothetical protein KR200_002064 [Drosophila serrata]|nr:hypothetical protein KR200_002064 [Drosophila serrata]
MLIGIYDYAAKLLNNMTATGATGGGAATDINKDSAGSALLEQDQQHDQDLEHENEQHEQHEQHQQQQQEPSKTPTPGGNLTTKLLQATSRALAQHVPALPMSLSLPPLPALLLQALDAADVAHGQRIDHPTRGPTTTMTTMTTTTTEGLPPSLLDALPTTTSSLLGNATATTVAVGGSPLSENSTDVVYSAFGAMPAGNLSGFIESSTTAASSVLSSAVTTLPTLPATSSMAATFQAQTVATFIAATGGKNRPTTIVVYPTVSPESIVIPIVSCIFGFPILALIVICCLRRRAKLARERDRRRNYDMQDHAVSLVRFSPIHRLNYRSSRAISLRPERSLSQGFTSLELDTVLEERCSDVEQTQTEILNPESPMDTASYKMSFSSS